MLPERFFTPRLILRPLAPGDAQAIFAGYAQDPEVLRYLGYRPHRLLADAVDYVARCRAIPPASGRAYALVGRGDGALRGVFELRRPEPHRVDCGYVLAKEWWGQGLMTEALGEVAGWAMAQDAIWRVS